MDTNIQTITKSFNNHDGRGREIGAIVVTFETDAMVGGRFAFQPGATRDGERFGASQKSRAFSTAAARDVAVSAYLADACKRAEAIGQWQPDYSNDWVKRDAALIAAARR